MIIKNNFIFRYVILALTITLFVACDNDSDGGYEEMIVGKWQVVERKIDMMKEWAPYDRFVETFSADGLLYVVESDGYSATSRYVIDGEFVSIYYGTRDIGDKVADENWKLESITNNTLEYTVLKNAGDVGGYRFVRVE